MFRERENILNYIRSEENLNTMPKIGLRPRYRILSSETPEEILNKIKHQIDKKENQIEGQIVQEHAFLRIPEKDQHYWSPELHVWVRQEEENSIVYGVMGPKPKIWTMFVFIYTAVITLSFFGSSYGIIQLILGIDAIFLWSIPLGIFAISLVYLASKYGQKKGREQMKILINLLEKSLNMPV